MYVTICKRCGEKYNLNVLTGECLSCGVDKYNDPYYSRCIADVDLTPDLAVRGVISKGKTEVIIQNKEGIILARGWEE